MSIELSLFKLADVLQLPLAVKGIAEVSGKRKAVMPLGGGLTFPFTMTAQKMFTKDQVGVLVHVAGDLHILVSHYQKTGSISAFLLDSRKMLSPLEYLITNQMNLSEVIDAVKPCVVKAFHWSGQKWSVLRLPS